MARRIVAVLFILALASPALAVDICVGATCRATDARQDRGAVFDCTEQLNKACTVVETANYALDEFIAVLDRWADNRDSILGAQQGINKGFLHSVAQEPSLSLATKCAVMADEGVQTAYESIYNVTCP